MTKPTDEPDSQPGGNDDDPSGVMADTGDDRVSEAGSKVDNVVSTNLEADEQAEPTELTATTDGSETDAELANEPAID